MKIIDTTTHNISKVRGQWPDEAGIIDQLDEHFAILDNLPVGFNVRLFQLWHSFYRLGGGHEEIPPTYQFPAAVAHAVQQCLRRGMTTCAYIHPFAWTEKFGSAKLAGEQMLIQIAKWADMGIHGVYFDGLPPYWDAPHHLTDNMIWEAGDFFAELRANFPDLKLWLHDSVSTRPEWYHREADVWLTGEGRPNGDGATPWRHHQGLLEGSTPHEHQFNMMKTVCNSPQVKLHASNKLFGGKNGDRAARQDHANEFSAERGGSIRLGNRLMPEPDQLLDLARLRHDWLSQ